MRPPARSLATAFLLTTWLSSIALSAEARCELDAIAVMPLRSVEGHFVFAADINGHAANLVLDTGASTTSLNLVSAPRLGVRLNLRESQNAGIGGSQRAYLGVARHMRVGALDLDGRFVGGTAASALPGLDGLLGMDAMSDYDIDLDTAGQHAILYEANGDCAKPTVSIARPLYAVPLEYSRNNVQAEVEISVRDRHFRAMIDSGSPTSVMFRNAAARLGLDFAGLMSRQGHWSRGIGAYPVRSFTHVFSNVAVGGLVFRNLPMDVLDQSGFAINRIHTGSLLPDDSSGEAGGEDILLGADFMQTVHVWISHSSQRLILQYPPQPSVLPR